MTLTRVYDTLLRLYPECYREQFAQEMITVFEEAAAEHRKGDWFFFRVFCSAKP